MVPPPHLAANPLPFKVILECKTTLRDRRNGTLPWSLQAGPRDPGLDLKLKDPL